MIYSLAGKWQITMPGFEGEITIPGTLDENGIGHGDTGANSWHPDQALGNAATPTEGPIATRLTRRHTYEGAAWLSRRVDVDILEGMRAFVEVERARCLRLFIDDREVAPFEPPTLSTRQVFEATGLIHRGAALVLVSDNSYPGLPREDIVNASAATDETQTNWNGLLGTVRLRIERPVFVRALRVYPRAGTLDVRIDLSAARPWHGNMRITGDSLSHEAVISVGVSAGEHEIKALLPLSKDVRFWDEWDGNLNTITAAPEDYESVTVRFGIRQFGDDGTGRLAMNGRRIFLRGETNCAVFPEIGHPPMTIGEWTEIMETYRAYGVSLVRFPSWCPPDAAFEAADRLGMLVQAELSHWNPRDALESDAAWDYYRRELRQILHEYANHPSLVMLTLGNELAAGETGHRRMDALLQLARALDDTRLYANGSNVHNGEQGCDAQSDFYTASTYYGEPLRGTMSGTADNGGALEGHINQKYPSARENDDAVLNRIRGEDAAPVFGFEVGQYEVLPDFGELDDFRGVTDPANLRLIEERVKARGIAPIWRDCVAATGELALLCYREEVEAALRTPGLSGLILLGLQDFPGQGTALVGMLNSHLRPKPYAFAKPERFAAFFRDQLPLAQLSRYTWRSDETLRTEIVVVNYGKAPIEGPLRWRLEGCGLSGTLPTGTFPIGGLISAGMIDVPLHGIAAPARLDLVLEAGGTCNRYPLWVYPSETPVAPEGIVAADDWEMAWDALKSGGRVFLDPPIEAELQSVPTRFSTDFWSVGTFPWQSGTMGQLIDAKHPIFLRFPTESHTNWQWWPMATRRAVAVPEGFVPIVRTLDSFATLRPLAQLFECRVGKGRLVFSAFGLRELIRWPECAALLGAIYDYMASGAFQPEQVLAPEDIGKMFL